MELSYINNPQSLFRKHHRLATLFANSDRGRNFLSQVDFFKPENEIALFLPNGWHEKVGEDTYKATFTTRAVFSPLLYLSLLKIDLALDKWKLSLEDQLEMLFIDLGLKTFSFEYPQVHLVTDTFNPDASPESTTADGRTRRSIGNPGEVFSTIRGGNGTNAEDSDVASALSLGAATTTNQWVQVARIITFFDTSSLSASADISNAVYSLYVTGTANHFSQSIGVVEATTASNTAIATSDYQLNSSQTTLQATAKTLASLSSSAYADYTLNATGISNISLTGITKFGAKVSSDYGNSAPSGWSSGITAFAVFNMADNGSNIPKLVIDYTIPAGGTNPMFFSTGGNTLG